jgi:hypothetical protein
VPLPVVVETQHLTTFANGPRGLAFATTPLPGDVVVVVYRCHLATGVRLAVSAAGMGASTAQWTGTVLADSGRMSVWTTTAATAAGTVTVTQNAAAPMTLTGYLIRNLTSAAIANITYGNANPGTPTACTSLGAFGQVVVGAMMAFDATLGAFTYDPTAPVAGWVQQPTITTATQGTGALYRIPTTGTPTAHTVTLDSSTVGDTINHVTFTVGAAVPVDPAPVITAVASPAVAALTAVSAQSATITAVASPAVAALTATTDYPATLTAVASAAESSMDVAIGDPPPFVPPRALVAGVLEADLGDEFDVIPYARDGVVPVKPTVMLGVRTIVRAPEAPIGHRLYAYSLWVLGSTTDPHGIADDELDAALEVVLDVIETTPLSLMWESAERVTYGVTTELPAYLVRLNVTHKKETRDE